MATLNTARVRRLLGYSIKGIADEKLYRLTELIGITLTKGGSVEFRTTDGYGYTYVATSIDSGTDEIDVAVDAQLFVSLINKITTDTFDMSVSGNKLVITANGKYEIALEPDENGGILEFPKKPSTSWDDDTSEIGSLTEADLRTISQSVKASLSPAKGTLYANYYVGDVVAATDKAMLSVFNKQILDRAVLLDRKFVDMICSCPESVNLYELNGEIVATSGSNDIVLTFYSTPKAVDEYNITAINKMVGLENKAFCRIRKTDLLGLLDRLSLFVGKFDDGAINMKFTDDGIEVSSINTSGVELVEYKESKDIVEQTIKINIDRLATQLKAYTSEAVDLYYGSEICIKLVDGDVTQVIALMR